MDMERVRSSIIAAALLFLTLVVLAANAGGGGGDDTAAAVEQEKQCHPRASGSEPYMLVAFHNKDGEEIRLLADQRNKQASGVSAFADRSGDWFYTGIVREGEGEGKRRRRLFPLPQPSNDNRSRGGSRTAEGFWNTLGVLVNSSTAASDSDRPAGGERYMVVGMQTGDGDKVRLLVVVADQRYFFITGYAKGFSSHPRWSFRDGERHRLLPLLGSNVSSSHGGGGGGSSSHAEVVASNVLAALMKAGRSSCG